MQDWHLAQANIARAVAPMDDPAMADFMAQLDTINALADRSPGFVWRLQSGSGNATDIAVTDDPLVILNMSGLGIGRRPVRLRLSHRPHAGDGRAAGNGSRSRASRIWCCGGSRRGIGRAWKRR